MSRISSDNRNAPARQLVPSGFIPRPCAVCVATRSVLVFWIPHYYDQLTAGDFILFETQILHRFREESS